MTVYIYNGYGASQANAKILQFMFSMALHPHGIPVKTIGQQDLNMNYAPWQNFGSVLVFGGGEFTLLKEKLTTYGRDAIRDFAAHKKYLGICKGAYAGASQIDFFGENTHKTSDGFGFFNGVARGSLPIAPALYTGMSNSAQVTMFRHEKRGIDFPALYWGGPHFDLSHAAHNADKLVTLKSLSSDKSITMGISVPVGKQGQAILLGYHPEAMQSHIREWVLKFSQDESDMARIEYDLKQQPAWKFYLGFACLLDDLGIVKNHSFLHQILNPPKGTQPIAALPPQQFKIM